MKQLLKFLHVLGAIGVIGALAAHMALVVTAAQKFGAEYAAVRFGIEAISKWMLVPSLALVLVAGCVATTVASETCAGGR
jgi:heme A synthase